MLTKNFKNLMAMILQSRGSAVATGLPITTIQNAERYLSPHFADYYSFPYAAYRDCRLNDDAGIHFGSGTTAATEDDYYLEDKIRAGLQFQLGVVNGLDDDGNPYLRYDIMVTNVNNIGGASITIGEIGYTQNAIVINAAETGNDRICMMLDRTVLTTPVTLAPQEYALIRYTLKTVISNGE